MVLERQLVTVDKFERLIDLPEYSDRRLELVHGEIVESAAHTQTHGRVIANVAEEIGMIEVYAAGQDVQILTENDTLDLSIVLPTLKIQLTELFRGA